MDLEEEVLLVGIAKGLAHEPSDLVVEAFELRGCQAGGPVGEDAVLWPRYSDRRSFR